MDGRLPTATGGGNGLLLQQVLGHLQILSLSQILEKINEVNARSSKPTNASCTLMIPVQPNV